MKYVGKKLNLLESSAFLENYGREERCHDQSYCRARGGRNKE
jgi:hypothetical protein